MGLDDTTKENVVWPLRSSTVEHLSLRLCTTDSDCVVSAVGACKALKSFETTGNNPWIEESRYTAISMALSDHAQTLEHIFIGTLSPQGHNIDISRREVWGMFTSLNDYVRLRTLRIPFYLLDTLDSNSCFHYLEDL